MAASRATTRRLRALAAALAPRSAPTAAPKPLAASGGGGAAFAPRLPDSPPSFRAGQEREATDFFDVYGFAILEEAHSPEECAPVPRSPPRPTQPQPPTTQQAQLSNLGGRRATGWRT